jgi:hypothetical protein
MSDKVTVFACQGIAFILFLVIFVWPAVRCLLFPIRVNDAMRAEQKRKDAIRASQGFKYNPAADLRPHSQTVITETHTEFIGVPCDSGLDLSRIADALNRQDTSTTDYRDQDDDNPGQSWGIIR